MKINFLTKIYHTSYYQYFFTHFNSALKYIFNTKLVRFSSINMLNDERSKINRLSLIGFDEYVTKIKINFKSKLSDDEVLQIHYENNNIRPTHIGYYEHSFSSTLEWFFKINSFTLNKLEDTPEYWKRTEDNKIISYRKCEFEYLEKEILKKVIMEISDVDLEFEINIYFDSNVNDYYYKILDYLTAKKVDKENLVIEEKNIPKNILKI
jgi:hypothetical protein